MQTKQKNLVLLLFALIFLSAMSLSAQITIGENKEPEKFSLLEIVSDQEKGGLRLPHLTNQEKENLKLKDLIDPQTQIRAKGLTIFNTDDKVIEFWDGSGWVHSKAIEPWMVAGTSNKMATDNDQNIYQMGSIGIGTSAINPSAVLDVNSRNKGVLFPKVSLVSNTDIVTVPNPARGLLVYNDGKKGLSVEGYVYWDGVEWKKFAANTTINPAITGLQCSEAKMNPTVFQEGVPYNGVMTIPYIGGNGGSYSAGTPLNSFFNRGLVAKLQSGDLKHGNGDFVFTLSGTPRYSSPAPAYFSVDILGKQCVVNVSGQVLGIGEYITFIGTLPKGISRGTLMSSIYPTELPVIDGLRVDLEYYDAIFYKPRVYNIGSSTQVVSFQTFATVVNENKTSLNNDLAPGDFLKIDNNDIVYWTSSAAEVITANLQVQIAPNIWRWYEMKWWAMEISNEKTIFLSVVRKA